jgi:hypothetical protein
VQIVEEVEMPKFEEYDRVPVSVKEIVEQEFKNSPVLIKISKCESGFKQLNDDGSVFRGRINSKDVGVMQINEDYHLKPARDLGMDIHTLKGNIAYALYLYRNEGLGPWEASRPCWSK